MKRQAIVVALGLAAGLWWGVGTGQAEQDANLARGFSPEKLYSYSGLDSVNLYNGSLSLVLPIGPRYPVGDQLSYGLTLSYSSNVWEPMLNSTLPQMVPRRSSDAGLGWMLSLGGQLYGKTHPSGVPLASAGFQFESEDGSVHLFYGSLHPSDGPQPEGHVCLFTRDNTYLRLCGSEEEDTRTIEFPDGTKRTYTRLPTFEGMRPWDVDRYRLTSMEDRFGNSVEVAYSGGTWTITDSLGRSHTASFHVESVDTDPMWVLDFVDLAGFDGARSRYDFKYDEPLGGGGGVGLVEIDRSCKTHLEAPGDETVFVPLLRKVLLPPDESGFRMSFQMPDYNTECFGGLKDLPGTLERLVLPTGGRLEWTYGLYLFTTPDSEDPVNDIVEQVTGVRTKTLLNEQGQCDGGGSCEWTYSATIDNQHRKTVVTTPLGDTHVSYFRQQRPHEDLPEFTGWDQGLPFTTDEEQAGLNLSQEIYDAGGTLKRSVYVAYERDQIVVLQPFVRWSQAYLNSNRRLKAQRTLYHDDLNNGVPRFTAVEYGEFDGLGHHRRVVTTGNLGGAASHTEITDYNPDRKVYELAPGTNDPIPGYVPFPPHPHPWVIGTFDSKRVEEPGSAFVSQYCFDPLTGRLKRKRVRASASGPDSHDVIVRSTRELGVLDEGEPTEMPVILYEDFIYGGDFQNLDTGTELCDIPLPTTPEYRTLNAQAVDGTLSRTEQLDPDNGDPILRTLDLVIDSSTGLAKTSTDPAGLATDFEYDKLGRLLWIKPGAGGDAWTEIYYCAAETNDPDCDLAGDPANVTVRRRLNGNENGNVLEESRSVYDSFGRVARDQRKIPGHGWTTVDTGYNALGWKTFVSERGPLGTVPYETRFKNYDPFGRPGRIELPDYPSDNRHFIELFYAGVRTVTRGVSIGSDLTGGETRSSTTELYDLRSRLRRVKEPSGPDGQVVDTTYGYDAAGRLVSVEQKDVDMFEQNRSFVYDGRGFLTKETHPENGVTEYSLHDPAGNAGRKTTGTPGGQFDLAYVYDDAQRLIKVRRWNGNLPLKEFTYGDGTAANDRSKGKIVTAVRHNHVLHPEYGNQLDVTVTETYTYGGTGGRPSVRTTELNTDHEFSQSWAYDQLGQVNQVNYPVCIHSGSACSLGKDHRPRLVTFQHQLGYLTGVPDWADTISYHANGMLNEIHHANGPVYGQGLDDHWMRRPGSLWIVHPTNNNLGLVGGGPNPPGTPLPYAYDGAGNVKSWFDWRYRYDQVSRVVEGKVVPAGEAQSYTYDPFGNILTIITDPTGNPDPPPTTVQLGVDRTTNRLSASLYDAAGNLVSRGDFSYGYDSLSMMKTMDGGGSENTYIYTADDERIWTVDSSDSPPSPWNETFTLRDLDGKVLRVFTTSEDLDFSTPTDDFSDLAWSHDYVYRAGQLLATARVDGAGETHHHFHLNHLGTPLLITDEEGGTEALHSYFPFGEEITPGDDTERMKYTGHERDFNQEGQTDDLDYMHARYYSPLLGRMLSPDRIVQMRRARAKPQMWNLYSYAIGNPLSYIDPTGLYIVVFGARSVDEAEDELVALKQALEEAGASDAAAQLQLAVVDGEVRITTTGSADLSSSDNSTVALIGSAINTSNRINLAITSSSLSAYGGATTKGFSGGADPSQITIRLNPETIRHVIVPGVLVGGAQDGQRVGLSVTLGTALVHELGHAYGYYAEGHLRFPALGQTNETALRYENQHRQLMAIPGKAYGRRMSHGRDYP